MKNLYEDREFFTRNTGLDVYYFIIKSLLMDSNYTQTQNISQCFTLPRYPGTHDKKSMMLNLLGYDQPVKFIEENVIEFSSGISSKKNCIFFKLLKDNVQRLFEAGITQKLKSTKYTNDPNYIKLLNVHEQAKNWAPLDLTMLEAGFIIWLVAVGISILVFFGEIIFYRVIRYIKRKTGEKSRQNNVKIVKCKRKCIKSILKMSKKLRLKKPKSKTIKQKSEMMRNMKVRRRNVTKVRKYKKQQVVNIKSNKITKVTPK